MTDGAIIYDHVITNAWPQVYVDNSKLPICQGNLAPPSKAKVESDPG
jgi:hypothetical protein